MESYPSVITSHTNPKIKKARSLHQKKFRERHRAFLVEGPRAITELLKSSWEVETLFFDLTAFRDLNLTARARHPARQVVDVFHLASQQKDAGERTVHLQAVTPEVLASISEVGHHQGCIAVAKMTTEGLDRWRPSRESFVIVLDGVADPGNVGTMIRTGDAFGAEAILLTEECSDYVNPKTVRATAGSLFHLPVLQGNRRTILAKSRSEQFQLAGAMPTAAVELLSWSPKARVALVFGHETRGISPVIERELDVAVAIPMSGRTESLNVAAACAVLSWEVFRKRETRSVTGMAHGSRITIR